MIGLWMKVYLSIWIANVLSAIGCKFVKVSDLYTGDFVIPIESTVPVSEAEFVVEGFSFSQVGVVVGRPV